MENVSSENQKKIRNSWVEVLRVLAMLLIFLHHTIYHGGTTTYGGTGINGFVSLLLFDGGKAGILIFTLIAGYYLLDSPFSLKRTFRFYFEVLLFSIGFLVFNQIKTPVSVEKAEITVHLIHQTLMPFFNNTYWYATTYIILLFFSPLLNLGLKSLTKSQYAVLLIFCIIVFFLVPSVSKFKVESSTFTCLLSCYVLAGFMKRFGFIPFQKNKWLNILNLVFAIGIMTGVTLLRQYSSRITFLQKYPFDFVGYTSVFMLAFSYFLFSFFINLKPFRSRIVNACCSGTFEVYLIHENPYFRKVLFVEIAKMKNIVQSPTWWLAYTGRAILVFFILLAIGGIIKFIYGQSFGRLINLIFDKITSGWSQRKKKKNKAVSVQ